MIRSEIDILCEIVSTKQTIHLVIDNASLILFSGESMLSILLHQQKREFPTQTADRFIIK